MEDIDKALGNVKALFELVRFQNDELRKENDKLKSEVYKDEEIARLQEKISNKSSFLNFYVSKNGVKVRDDFLKRHKCGGILRMKYEFHPTGIGNVVYLVCGCGKKILLESQI